MNSMWQRALGGLRWLVLGVSVAAVTVGASLLGATIATDSPGRTAAFEQVSGLRLAAAPGIDRQQAIDAALRAVPGASVVEAELDSENGITVWDIELRTPEGIESEVHVDANSGAIVNTHAPR